MILVLLIVVPLITGIFSFVTKGDGAKILALIGSMVTLGVAGFVSGSNFRLLLHFHNHGFRFWAHSSALLPTA